MRSAAGNKFAPRVWPCVRRAAALRRLCCALSRVSVNGIIALPQGLGAGEAELDSSTVRVRATLVLFFLAVAGQRAEPISCGLAEDAGVKCKAETGS